MTGNTALLGLLVLCCGAIGVQARPWWCGLLSGFQVSLKSCIDKCNPPCSRDQICTTDGDDLRPICVKKETACEQAIERGGCLFAMEQWAFDAATGGCERFDYSGCGGNANRFDSAALCRRHCVQPLRALPPLCRPACRPGDWCVHTSADCRHPPCAPVAQCITPDYAGCETVDCQPVGYICHLGSCLRASYTDNDACATVRCAKCFRCFAGDCIADAAQPGCGNGAAACAATTCEECSQCIANIFDEPRCVRLDDCCPDGEEATNCLVDPCEDAANECPRSRRCVSRYCNGQCTATFYDEFMNALSPETCRPQVPDCQPQCSRGDKCVLQAPQCITHPCPDTQASVCVPDVAPCKFPADSGPCEAYMPRFFFNATSSRCDEFIFGGCGGNDNNFDTREDCERRCMRRPPDRPSGNGFCPMVDDAQCVSLCDRDDECEGELKCCKSRCGGSACVAPADEPLDRCLMLECARCFRCEDGKCVRDWSAGGCGAVDPQAPANACATTLCPPCHHCYVNVLRQARCVRSSTDCCPDGIPVASCFADPCEMSDCPASIGCVSNLCGGCSAENYDRLLNRVQPEQCQLTQAPCEPMCQADETCLPNLADCQEPSCNITGTCVFSYDMSECFPPCRKDEICMATPCPPGADRQTCHICMRPMGPPENPCDKMTCRKCEECHVNSEGQPKCVHSGDCCRPNRETGTTIACPLPLADVDCSVVRLMSECRVNGNKCPAGETCCPGVCGSWMCHNLTIEDAPPPPLTCLVDPCGDAATVCSQSDDCVTDRCGGEGCLPRYYDRLMNEIPRQACERRRPACYPACSPSDRCVEAERNCESPPCPKAMCISRGKCFLPSESGDCEAAMPRVYYNAMTRSCEDFTYGGCGGNENNFESHPACEEECAGQGYDNKPGECRPPKLGELAICADNCAADSDCDGEQKCCRNGCGALTCQPLDNHNPCTDHECGECEHCEMNKMGEPKCVLDEGCCPESSSVTIMACPLPVNPSGIDCSLLDVAMQCGVDGRQCPENDTCCEGACGARSCYKLTADPPEQPDTAVNCLVDPCEEASGRCPRSWRCVAIYCDRCQPVYYDRLLNAVPPMLCEDETPGGGQVDPPQPVAPPACEPACGAGQRCARLLCRTPPCKHACIAVSADPPAQLKRGICRQPGREEMGICANQCHADSDCDGELKCCRNGCGATTCQQPMSRDEMCGQPMDAGPCRAAVTRFYLNGATEACEEFIYGGCNGNSNNFLTPDHCRMACSQG